jgi:hypothetical protein
MGASSMADDPIRSGEFNQAMEMLRGCLSRLELGQATLAKDISDLYDLHRTCMVAQSDRAFKAGQESERITSLESRTKGLETENRTNVSHKRQLGIGIALTAIASLLSIVVSSISRK